MKKLILMAAVAIFSLGASAQKFKPVADFSRMHNVVTNKGELNANIEIPGLQGDVTLVKKAQTRINDDELPKDGIRKDYFLFYQAYVNKMSYLYYRAVKQTLVFSKDGKTVYIPLMMLDTTSGLDGVYIPCERQTSGEPGVDQLIVPNEYVVGQAKSSDGYVEDVKVSQLNFLSSDYEPLESNAILYYNTTTDEIIGGSYQIPDEDGNMTIQPLWLGVYQGNDIQPINMCTNLTYYPVNENFFDAPATRPYSYVNDAGETVTGVATEYCMPQYGPRFYNGLFNNYKNSWALMLPTDTQASSFSMTAQYLDESNVLVWGKPSDNGSVEVDDGQWSVFNYDGASDIFTQQDGDHLYDIAYVPEMNNIAVLADYSNIILGKATPVGINNVTTSTDKEAVATEYYDLSGRRVSAAEKGVTIKVEKYADGTSKATKVMK